MSIADTRSWRGIAAIIRRPHRDDEHAVTVEIREVPAATGKSGFAWPASEERTSPAPELSPSAPLLPLERRQVTVHRELDDDEVLAASLLAMERETHAEADRLAAENDARMERLLDWSLVAVRRSADALAGFVFRWRRSAITPLVLELGHLLAAGDVDSSTAAAVMGLRSRYLSSPDESQRIPKLTPELLAELDAKRGVAA